MDMTKKTRQNNTTPNDLFISFNSSQLRCDIKVSTSNLFASSRLLGVNLLGGWIDVTELWKLFPGRRQIKLAELLSQLERFTDDAFLFVIVAQLKQNMVNVYHKAKIKQKA